MTSDAGHVNGEPIRERGAVVAAISGATRGEGSASDPAINPGSDVDRNESGGPSPAPASSPTNRGPAVAAQNRRAILQAARNLLAAEGYNVPLSAIAREAGVSQGVMYRHFHRRVDLALEAFEDNFGTMEQMVALGGGDTLHRLWSWLLARAVDEVGFIETIRAARAELPDYKGVERLHILLQAALDMTRASGAKVGNVRPADLVLAWRMAYGLVATSGGGVTAGWLEEVLSLEAVERMFGRQGSQPIT